MRRDGSGFLACPDEGSGRDATTLDKGNAAGARIGRRVVSQDPGGLTPFEVDPPTATMVPLVAGVRDPHTNIVIPAEGVESTVDLLWLQLRDTGRVSFQDEVTP